MNRAIFLVILGGLVAGAFDISYAISFSYFRSGVSPERLLQYVASGLLGKDEAFSGGSATAALGLGLHFFINCVASAVYFLAAGRIGVMLRRPVLSGLGFGALMFAFMNLVVLPLSRTPPRTTFPLVVLGTGLLVHMFLVGVPMALAARRARAALRA